MFTKFINVVILMVFIVQFMIGWSMLMLLLSGIQAKKMHDNPPKFWRDQNDDTNDDNDESNDESNDNEKDA